MPMRTMLEEQVFPIIRPTQMCIIKMDWHLRYPKSILLQATHIMDLESLWYPLFRKHRYFNHAIRSEYTSPIDHRSEQNWCPHISQMGCVHCCSASNRPCCSLLDQHFKLRKQMFTKPTAMRSGYTLLLHSGDLIDWYGLYELSSWIGGLRSHLLFLRVSWSCFPATIL
jgi:hypothetical protein